MTPQTLILLALAIPVACIGPVLLARRRPDLREAFSLLAGIATFACVLLLYGMVAAGERPELVLGEMLPGLPLVLRIEPLGMLFALIASGLWPVTTLYAIGYMRGHHEKNQTRFYAFFALAISCALGIAFSGNMLTLFVFYEALTIGTFPLVTHAGTKAAKRAGRVYLGILLGTSVCFLLLAIVWTWTIAGTLDFVPGGILAGKVADWAVAPLLALYVFGIGKAALMPFHRWLPAAMVAPTPVSALLHAVAVVKAGVFTVLKVTVHIFGLDLLNAGGGVPWLAGAAGFTIIAASLVAMSKDNLKARLAYSTISQLSYVVLGAMILAPLSVMGASIHIAAHAFGKITLFFAAGAVMVASHKTEISQMAGIGRRMPWTMGAFAVGALSMIGLPPTAGFVSKWYVLNGAVESGHMAAVGVVIVSTLLNAAYFLPIIHSAFFGEEKHDGDHRNDHGEAPLPAVAALVITATATVAFFVAPDWAIGLGGDLVGRAR
ncbi:monovalent cation/H+ antiporter subunit D family protein [Magnetospirillum sp. SS-4]|uniref:monovalent cation/H+ antiporter subunit D family protein n=1 Tax=Magnetospirillum sp. SS-4 TaxID=2681465 RepID=UPI00137E7657|nr:monovalent cation/H+ antiporter subunit D family protein [Magnetospirillum sp. SS-4]CAA7620722.1 NADH-ubiquinone oxidoreductase chain L [Magnetospirillum sp. SS-4]